mmetsp:Transcript_26790/g.50401  ORF Transcript_26790/g.50401 Transcript_26790/m.50401 type:complete len:164 (+) Transcript_26790:98-589(+)
MRKYLLFLGLLSLTWHSAWCDDDEEDIGGIEIPQDNDESMEELEEGDDMEDELDLSEDAIEEPPSDGDRHTGKMSEHPLYQECMELAEKVESDVGLYDEAEVGHEGRQKLAAALKEHAVALMKKESPTFEGAFLKKLEETHAASGGFGASDACDFLLEHHQEL